MDLGTITQRLNSGHYERLGDGEMGAKAAFLTVN
jgi:hypothetical protein